MHRRNGRSDYDDPRWKERAAEIKRAKGGKCELCGASTGIDAHHVIYRPRMRIWEQPDEEFMVLCRPCHFDRHDAEAWLQESILMQGKAYPTSALLKLAAKKIFEL